jgi:hypothetical protein
MSTHTPPSIRNLYAEYKLDHGILVYWIGATVRQSGYFGTSKKKKNTRRAKKEEEETTTTTIALGDYEAMAKAIIVAKPPTKIPLAVIQLLRRIISKRKRVGEWYGPDDGHLYAIRVLEKTLQVFLPHSVTPAPIRPATASASSRKSILTEEF